MGRIIAEKGELFEQRPLKRSLEEFLDTWLQVLDIVTLVSMNVFRSRSDGEVRAILSKLTGTEEFKRAKMPLTKKLFESLGLFLGLLRTWRSLVRTVPPLSPTPDELHVVKSLIGCLGWYTGTTLVVTFIYSFILYYNSITSQPGLSLKF